MSVGRPHLTPLPRGAQRRSNFQESVSVALLPLWHATYYSLVHYNSKEQAMKTKTTKPALRAAQVRVLAALAAAAEPMTRKQIAEAAECDLAGLTEWIGSSDPAKRKANDVRHWPSLLSRKLVAAKDA